MLSFKKINNFNMLHKFQEKTWNSSIINSLDLSLNTDPRALSVAPVCLDLSFWDPFSPCSEQYPSFFAYGSYRSISSVQHLFYSSFFKLFWINFTIFHVSKPYLLAPLFSTLGTTTILRHGAYLLLNLQIVKPNQVWSTNITYIPMKNGFMFLVAVLDWYTDRYCPGESQIRWDADFCLEALESTLKLDKPDIFNTDQGPQFTCIDFTSRLEREGIQISMDERERVFDNIFVERLWRTVN